MSTSDPIADLLTRIRNAGKAKHLEVALPSSNFKAALAEVLKKEGYIEGYQVNKEDGKLAAELVITLRYYKGAPAIEAIKRVSKPSCRQYVGAGDIPRVRGGLGISILSTSKGVVSDRVARKENMGGEILCQVW